MSGNAMFFFSVLSVFDRAKIYGFTKTLHSFGQSSNRYCILEKNLTKEEKTTLDRMTEDNTDKEYALKKMILGLEKERNMPKD